MYTKFVDPDLNQERQLLVPLQDVTIKGILEAGHATLDVQLSYSNIGDDNPIECTFEFPIEKNTVVSKLIAQIDDKVIEAKIKAKEEAKQQYDDALASGNTAVYAERDQNKKEESITLLLGNLLPGQVARIDIQMIKPLTIEGGAFEFAMPTSFLPQYKQHQVAQNYNKIPSSWYLPGNEDGNLAELVPEYTFSYDFEIKSSEKVTFVGAPADAVSLVTPTGYSIKTAKSSNIPKREIRIFYKTSNMFAPQLKYEFDAINNEYACMASFVPTFEPNQTTNFVVSQEAPEEAELTKGEEFCFIFLVDRSGSMSGRRMEITKEALKLFIQSLPIGCTFAILGFGTES